MIFMLKLFCIGLLATLTYQDFKERKVWLWILLLTIFNMGFLHWSTSFPEVFWPMLIQNISVLFILFFILFLYANFKMKLKFNEGIGLGDILFFLGLAIGFPTYSFVILLVGSLLFSLLIFGIIKTKLKVKTVPLVGLQALFMALIFALNWMFKFTNLYAY